MLIVNSLLSSNKYSLKIFNLRFFVYLPYKKLTNIQNIVNINNEIILTFDIIKKSIL